MIKTYSTNVIALCLITVLVMLQWSATHIHLAEQHDHAGHSHKHYSQTHTHYTPNHHTDNIEPPHSTDNNNIVEIDNDCTSPGWKNFTDLLAISDSNNYQRLLVTKAVSVQCSELSTNKQSYITYSTTQLRAPPHIS